jgi:predicted amidohydrolase
MPQLKVATAQFPVSGNLSRNAEYIHRLARAAAAAGAEVVHFPETALPGYAGVNLPNLDAYAWEALRAESERLLDLARALSVWLVVGSMHPLSAGRGPHNALYVINARGEIVDRYDKLFCTRQDLKHYTPGDTFASFDLKGVRCGLLICHDLRYPELYREYYRRGVRCLFQSFHNANFPGRTIHTAITRPTLQGHAANNYFWLSVSNACGHYQSWPSVFIAPDGAIRGQLRQHRAGWMLNCVDTEEPIKDKCSFRDLAMQGVLHSGEAVDDPRSRARQSF